MYIHSSASGVSPLPSSLSQYDPKGPKSSNNYAEHITLVHYFDDIILIKPEEGGANPLDTLAAFKEQVVNTTEI